MMSSSLEPTWMLAQMTLVSLCLYHGGMVLNDAFDAPIDAHTQPKRPIPQGLISEEAAFRLSYLLIGVGCLVGTRVLPLVLALTACIVGYNCRYKYSLAGPPLMGMCRFLNVLLGATAIAPLPSPLDELKKTPPESADVWNAAFVVGLFILGVTWFAQDETTEKPRWKLAGATSLSLAALALGSITMWRPAHITLVIWVTGWIVVALIATRGMIAAVLQPIPKNIGRGVGIAIQGLVVIDAVLAAIYAGPVAGLAILALLPVTMLLSRWIPQT